MILSNSQKENLISARKIVNLLQQLFQPQFFKLKFIKVIIFQSFLLPFYPALPHPLPVRFAHQILTHPCRHHKRPIKWPTAAAVQLILVVKSMGFEMGTNTRYECYRNVIFPINKPFIGIYSEITTTTLVLFSIRTLSVCLPVPWMESRNANYRFYYNNVPYTVP